MPTQRTAYVGGDRAVGPRVAWERRLETLEAWIEHLEGALERLQDAVYRQAVLEGEKPRRGAQADGARADGA
jgi:hypothetical protein